MKFFGAAAVLIAGTGAWASNAGQLPKRVVTVCLNSGASDPVLNRGRNFAIQILKQAGIQLEWKSEERSCVSDGSSIVLTISPLTSKDRHPGALAFAVPFGRRNIVVFYDRVLDSVGTNAVPCLLGYVLAHEIAHILQGLAMHSADGIMKAHWRAGDYAEMQRGRFRFAEEDVLLIQTGFDSRSRVTPVK